MRLGYVYFIRVESVDGPVKIGLSRHLKGRFELLQQWSPWPLTLVAAFECPDPEKEERALHRRLSSVRVRGEWFRNSLEVKREILALSRRFKRVDVSANDLREGRRLSALVRLRVPVGDAQKYRQTARRHGVSLSVWIRDKLNKYAAARGVS
jgi:hypothetical protein